MKKLTSLILSLLLVQFAFSQSSTFSGSGNWNTSARWSNGIPTAGTAVTIANGATCTINVTNAVCASMTVASGGTNTTITISSGNKLTVSGNVTLQAPTSNTRFRKLDVSAGTLDVGGDITLENTSASSRDCIFNIGTGVVNLTGDFIMNGTSSENILEFTAANDGDLNIGGTLSGAGTLTEATGTITYNNAGNQTIAATTYYNLGIDGSGTKTCGGSFTVSGGLNLTAGKLSINGTTLTVNGDVTRNSGAITGSSTSNLTIAGTASNCTLYFDQTSSATRSLNNFTLSRPNGATIADTLEIDNTLSITNNATLNTNNQLILVSTASSTARVADLSAGTISGKVIAQRYVPGGTDKRRWRFFSSPTNITNNYNYYQFIDDIHVTGAGGSANGFDNSPNNSSSARTYDETVSGASSNGWSNPSVLNTNIPVGKGVSVFVRGSRATQDPFLNWSTPDNVTIDFTGNLNQGTINISSQLTYTVNTPTADGFNLVGNPYMSQIDWSSANITKTNIGNYIYIINPSTGAYATYDESTQTSVNGGSRYIASSQGFFVRTTGASPSIIFNETAKVTNTAPTFFRADNKATVTNFSKLKLKAIRNAENTDELVVVFGDTAHKSGIDASDAVKFFNDNNLNIYTRSNDLRNLAINYFPTPTSNDTIPVSFFSFVDGIKALGTYSIEVASIENFPGNVDVFLVDNYANQVVNLKETNNYIFNLDLNAASAGNDRFKLVFKPDTSTFTKITNFSGITANKNIVLNWSTNKEKNIAYYTVEKSYDQVRFTSLKPKQVIANNNNSGFNSYSIIDNNPRNGYNYYRVTMVDSNGVRKTYAEVVAIQWKKKHLTESGSVEIPIAQKTTFSNHEQISIFPNPAQNNVSLRIYTDFEENNLVEICDITGKIISKFEVPSQEIRNIDISTLEKGLYLIRSVSETSGKQFTTKLIKE